MSDAGGNVKHLNRHILICSGFSYAIFPQHKIMRRTPTPPGKKLRYFAVRV